MKQRGMIAFSKCDRCGKTLAVSARGITGAQNPVGTLCQSCATDEEKHKCDLTVLQHVADTLGKASAK